MEPMNHLQMCNQKTKYDKYEYQQAKRMIAAAEIVWSSSSPVNRYTVYKLDGQFWVENESLLESPEDGYTLSLRNSADAIPF